MSVGTRLFSKEKHEKYRRGRKKTFENKTRERASRTGGDGGGRHTCCRGCFVIRAWSSEIIITTVFPAPRSPSRRSPVTAALAATVRACTSARRNVWQNADGIFGAHRALLSRASSGLLCSACSCANVGVVRAIPQRGAGRSGGAAASWLG